MVRILIKTATLVACVIVVGACAQSPLGVFESIQLERRIIDDRDLDNELVVGAMAQAQGKYFIAAATLWQRNVADPDYQNGDISQWASVQSPGTSNYTTSALVAFDGSGSNLVYAVYSSQDATDAGIYEIDPAGTLDAVTATERVFGTEVTDIIGLGEIFVANDGVADQLIVSVRKTGTSNYSAYFSSTGGSGSFAEIPDTLGNLPIIDVANATTGEVFFLTRKSLLVDSDGLGAGGPAAPVTGALFSDGRQPEYGGLFYDTVSSTLFVTDNEGYLYRSTDLGANWTSNASPHETSTTDDTALSFTDVSAVDKDGTRTIVVGTNQSGYRELGTDFVPSTPNAEGSNYQASDLAQATVLTFFVDPGSTVFIPAESGNTFVEATGDLLFAGTSNLGLWKALYTSADPQWVRE